MITPFLTEVLTTNVPLSIMLRPKVLLFMIMFGYGFAVLLLREAAIRMRAGLVSLVLLGLIYGIYNEGLIAKTFFRPRGLPIPLFDGYGFWGGVETAWALAIGTWHAFFAFLFPVVLVHSLYPSERDAPWLNRPARVMLAAITVIVSALAFFGGTSHAGSGAVGHYGVMALLAALLFLTARARRCASLGPIVSGGATALTPAVYGIGLYLAVMLVPAGLAAARVPMRLYLTYFGVLALVSLRWIVRREAIAVGDLRTFAFGGQFAVALVALAAAAARSRIESVFTSTVFLVALSCLLYRSRSPVRSSEGRAPNPR